MSARTINKGPARVGARLRIFARLSYNSQRIAPRVIKNQEMRLLEMAVMTGTLATFVKRPKARIGVIHSLQHVAAFAIGWAEQFTFAEGATMVNMERERQEALLKGGVIRCNCANETIDPILKLRVLLEEIGEVAEALDKLENLEVNPDGSDEYINLTTELIQVAAVCVAWLESMEEE